MIIINLAGLSLIALIVWWFWIYKPRAAKVEKDDMVIVVDNGIYQPAHIRVLANQPVSLNFLRKDASPCAEMVIIPDLEISESLPLNKTKRIQLPPMQKGEYTFHCQMKMYRGKLIVE